MEMLLTGYEDYALKSGDQKAYETIRILNVALGRAAYKTLPLIMEGKPGAALQYELGIYKTAESKKFKDDAAAMLPEDVIQALAALKAHQQAAISREGLQTAQGGKGGVKSGLRGKSYLES